MAEHTFDTEGVRRIVRTVRKSEGTPSHQSLRNIDLPHAEAPTVNFQHSALASSDIVPPYGVMAVLNTTLLDDNTPLYITQVPSTTFRKHYLVNGPDAVAGGDYGQGYLADPPLVQYSTPPTTSFEGYGPKPGSWALDKFYPQTCESLGIVNSSTVAGSSATPTMQATLHPIRELLVKATSPIAASSDGIAEVLFGVSPSETTSGWRITVKTLTGQSFTSDQEFTVHDVDGQWYAMAGGRDIFVAVTSENTPRYLGESIEGWLGLSSAQYESGKDFSVEAGHVGSTPLQTVKFYVDASDMNGHTAGEREFLSKTTNDDLEWTTNVGTAADVKLAATSQNSGVYWNALHNEFNATTQLSTSHDFIIESEAAGTTPNQTIRQYIDASDLPNYDAAYDQLLMHKTSNGPVWRRLIDQQYTATFSSNADPVISFDWTVGVDSDLKAYLDASRVSGYSLSAYQALTHDSGGNTVWDGRKVQLSSTHAPNYLGTLHTGYTTVASFELNNDPLIDFEENGSEILGFIDASAIVGYLATTPQLLGHAGDASMQWTTPSAGSATDEKLAATSENDGKYWNTLHNDYNSVAQFASSKDFLVESDVIGTTPNQTVRLFVDASDIPGFSASAFQYLTKDTSDVLNWSTLPSVDEKLAATSENDGKYWSALHNEYNASTVYAANKDLLVESEVAGTTPNQTLKLYIDVSDIGNYDATTRQFLTHDSSGILAWVGVSTCT